MQYDLMSVIGHVVTPENDTDFNKLWSRTSVQHNQLKQEVLGRTNSLLSLYRVFDMTWAAHRIVLLLLHVYSFPQERVYRAVA
jgi:hypothetical protein